MIPKILVVDDEPDLEELLSQKFRRKIRKEELSLIFASNGNEALKKLEEHPDTDMVITDINMPVMDGLTLLGNLKENYPFVKTIVLSAYGDMQKIRTAMNRGAFDFLNKPMDFEDLEITIDKTLAHVKQLKESQAIKEEAEKARDELLESLQKMDKLKDEFLANTSHELRTPLNGIIGIAESMVEGATGPLSDVQVSNLLMLTTSGKRLSTLINDILDFAKLKHKNIELNLKPVGIREISNLVFTFSKPLLGKKPVALINKVSPDFPLIYADENRLLQIMHNLVGNAVKFTEAGEIEVYAEIKDKQVLISISDTGIGIPEDKFANIFIPFEQADGTTERKYGGTGIGLSITRQLVELHKGSISVKSSPGKGSIFTFTLPINEELGLPQVPVSGDSQENNSSGTDTASTNNTSLLNEISVLENRLEESISLSEEIVNLLPGTGNDFSVLIVDDEPINLHVLRNQLSLQNYSITQALNGLEAMEAIRSDKKFDLVLLDLMMPIMSGYEVCEKIREIFPASELPIVMLTAKNQTEDIVNGFNYGANDYIVKPFSKSELLARIKAHIQLSKINFAYGRFVPHEFLRFLGRESIINVKLGDQVQKEMTILFSDIRSFTTLSETMTPVQNFNFLNSYLSRVSPIIRNNHGFIDKYIGDAIMALFPEKIEDALLASIDMLEAVKRYNMHRVLQDYVPINIGIGLHTGKAMLGTIGEYERMEGTVISDAVNLASRLEGLTKFYGVSIVVSEQVLNGLTNKEKYKYRFLDTVKVKGKNNSVSIFEVFDADPEDILGLKLQTLDKFNEGIEHYQNKRFQESMQIFKQIFELNKNDKAAFIYLNRCEKLLKYGVADDWMSIEALSEK